MNDIIANEAYEQAYTLHRKIIINAQAAQVSLFEVCKGLKEMREKEFYKELGYKDIEEYSSAELGMTSRNVRRYISVAEMVENERTPVSANLGITKLYLLSTLSDEEREEVAETTDLEAVSKRELEEKIKNLKAQNADIMAKLNAAGDKVLEAERKETKAFEQLSVVKTDSEMLSKKVIELQAEIKELNSRPIEVAVDEEAEKKYKEKLKKKEQALTELRSQLEETREKLRDEKAASENAIKAEQDKHSAQINELEKKLAEKPKEIKVPVDEDKVAFKIKLSTAYEALMPAAQYAAASDKQDFKDKLIALLDAARKVVEPNE